MCVVRYQCIQHIQNLQKRHNYAIAQKIFNRFSQNQTTVSWHIHLRIFTDSFIKFVQKLWEIYGKTNVSLFLNTVYSFSKALSKPHPLLRYRECNSLLAKSQCDNPLYVMNACALQSQPVSVRGITAGNLLIRRLPDKSSSADPVPTSVLKEIADMVAPFIVQLFNRLLCKRRRTRRGSRGPRVPRSQKN